jgi:calcineurin-like phosphoesterase family protein
MRVWFTADLHLGHGNIIKYCQRPFLTADEAEHVRANPRDAFRVSDDTVRRHDDELLDAINTRVEPHDMLWVVGDFSWGGLVEAARYRGRIRCRNLFLVWGNHDHRDVAPVFTAAFEQTLVNVEGRDIWLNHYPMRSWNKSFHGSWHLYGHVHGRFAAEDRANDVTLVRDVGVDACGYKPVSFEELREYMAPRFAKFRARKAAFEARGEEASML